MSLLERFRLKTDPDSEAALVRAAQRGDRRAFDTLVRAHAGPLRGFLARRVGPDAAEDVLQETWLAGWAALPRYGGRSRFKAWLYGIALHKCTDHQRAQGRARTESLSETRGGEEPFPPDVFAEAERAEAVRAALSRLPEAQRQVLDLYFYAELTLPEIAQSTGRNLNTVKYQFYRAHALVAQDLQEYAPAPARDPQRTTNGAYPQ